MQNRIILLNIRLPIEGLLLVSIEGLLLVICLFLKFAGRGRIGGSTGRSIGRGAMPSSNWASRSRAGPPDQALSPGGHSLGTRGGLCEAYADTFPGS